MIPEVFGKYTSTRGNCFICGADEGIREACFPFGGICGMFEATNGALRGLQAIIETEHYEHENWKSTETAWTQETAAAVQALRDDYKTAGIDIRKPRKTFVESAIETLEADITAADNKYSELLALGVAYSARRLAVTGYKRAVKELTRLRWELRVLNGQTDAGGITPEMVQAAKDFPIGGIIEVVRKVAVCVNHADRRPSMSINNNHAHCFSCSWTGDSIDVFMKINAVSFPVAVKRLANGG